MQLRTEHYAVLGILRDEIAIVEKIAAILELPVNQIAALRRRAGLEVASALASAFY